MHPPLVCHARGVFEFNDWTFQKRRILLAFDHTGDVIDFRTYSNESEYDVAREELWNILDEGDPVEGQDPAIRLAS
jgi:hypothetical protein